MLRPRTQVAEGLLDYQEQAAVTAVLNQVPAGVVAASESGGTADLVQAYVDAMAGADEERATAVRSLVAQQVSHIIIIPLAADVESAL